MTTTHDRPTTATATADPAGPAPAVGPAPAPPGMARTALTLGAFVALGPLTIDMYLPALPTVADDLMTTSSAVQLTLTGTLVGMGLGQIVIGPLSDAVGRRNPLLLGTALHVVASLLVLVAPNVAVLGALRVLQGVGVAAGMVIAMAVIRDLYDGRAAATMISRIMLVIGAFPVLAPTLGGEVLRFTTWRGVFVILAAFGLLLVVVGWFVLRETLPVERRVPVGVRSTLRSYRGLFGDRVFVGLVLVGGLVIAGLFSYVSGAAFVYQDEFGLDEQEFGLLFGAGAIWLIVATQLNPVFLKRWATGQILLASTVGGAVAGVALVVLAVLDTGSIWAVALPMWVVLFFAGLGLPNAPALALSRHGEAAGTAAALLGAVQFVVGAAVAPMVGVLGNDALAMGVIVVVAMVLSLVVLVTMVRPWQLPDPSDDEDAAFVVAH
ncbi:multidrug effflux MFS transporter [Trujillonella endophytica]|uniref:MFS transporter, DHA1 family, bicyclomycin/chloramphenicol resistance protein n=1 Tax=Trujillonella endophytica TaxID=673521 RepID=A0A1H8UAR7_9ACTN|nr:multidrug effflux MFS transporter [Trujillella endophytica]SEP00275.1 MFS transporter, DHA1 family, bicyclomycin/chloramphenicol resistance protein [Trujillella endophytica]